jgi:hypothetical protein
MSSTETRGFSHLHSIDPLWELPTLYPVNTRDVSLGVKRAEGDREHSLLSIAEVKDTYNCGSYFTILRPRPSVPSVPQTNIMALLDATPCIGSKVLVFRRDALLPSSGKKEKPRWEIVLK